MPISLGDVGEGAVAVVVEKLGRRPARIADEQVGPAVVVVVDPRGAFAAAAVVAKARLGGDLLEGAVSLVVVQAIGLAFAADEQVEETVVVVIGPGRAGELTGSSRPAFSVTSVKVPSPLFRSRLGRIGHGSHAPRLMKTSRLPSLS